LKPYTLKQLIYHLVILVSMASIMSCSELLPKPVPVTDTTGTATGDTTVKVDTVSPRFNNPAGLAIDGTGNIYVADYGNNLIRKITPAGVVSTVAGTGNEGSINATGVLASFNGPSGIAFDAAGNLYIADSGNNLIRKMNTSALVTTLAGGDTIAMTNGIGINASFFGPMGLAVDGSGNVYVADAGDNMIRLITPAAVVSTFAANAVVTDSLTSLSGFNNPTGVALDSHGNLIVANYLNNNLLQVNQSGVVSMFAGSGLQGNADGPAATASFYLPNSVAVDANNNVYVSDGINNVIRKITPDGTVSTLAGSGTAGAIDGTGTAASFNDPAGLAVDAAGNVYVADASNNEIRKITPAGVVTTIAGIIYPGSKDGTALAHTNTKAVHLRAKARVNVFYRRRA
jgi:sugar lactone lactonase YvrE